VRYVERHPLGSQAFFPLGQARYVVIVAPPGESVSAADLRAFLVNGSQGVNYRPGVWHHVLLVLDKPTDFLVVDRGGPGHNCDEFHFEAAHQRRLILPD
jgi:ureidoglycolate lyase